MSDLLASNDSVLCDDFHCIKVSRRIVLHKFLNQKMFLLLFISVETEESEGKGNEE